MRWLIPGLLLLCAVPAASEDIDGLRIVEFGAERFSTDSRDGMEYCIAAPSKLEAGQDCNFTRFIRTPAKAVSLQVAEICDYLRDRQQPVGRSQNWLLASLGKPGPPVPVYRVDCHRERAYPIVSPATSGEGPAQGDGELGSLRKRLERVEQGLAHLQESLRRSGRADEAIRRLERELAALRDELKRRLTEIEATVRAGCRRSDGQFKGRPETMVAVGDSVLRFLAVEPRHSVVVGLPSERAAELLREVQDQTTHGVVPWILRSIPAVERQVAPFLVQDRLIDPDLYAELTGGGNAKEVSYNEVRTFLSRLNERCRGTARFDLPSEEQFVAAAKTLYDPASHGLVPCATVSQKGSLLGLTQLLGHGWQLTRSLCRPFEEGDPGAGAGPAGAAPLAPEPCPDGSFVRKGGTATASNPLECMPEYRSAAVPNVAQQQTSFRLVLAE